MYKRIRKNKEKFLAFAVSCMVLGMPQAFAAENTGGGISGAEENVTVSKDSQEAASAKDYDLGGTVISANRRKIKNPYTTMSTSSRARILRSTIIRRYRTP